MAVSALSFCHGSYHSSLSETPKQPAHASAIGKSQHCFHQQADFSCYSALSAGNHLVDSRAYSQVQSVDLCFDTDLPIRAADHHLQHKTQEPETAVQS